MLVTKTKRFFNENLGAPFILGFQALLLVCAGLLAFDNLTNCVFLANEIAVVAYFMLVIGVILQLFSFLRFYHSREDKKDR